MVGTIKQLLSACPLSRVASRETQWLLVVSSSESSTNYRSFERFLQVSWFLFLDAPLSGSVVRIIRFDAVTITDGCSHGKSQYRLSRVVSLALNDT